MLKKVVCACCAALVFLALACPVRAEVARFVAEDKNASYHAAHLLLHAGTTDCRATGIRLRLRVRSTPGGNDTIGHLEQADQFLLLEVQDNWARVSVTRPGPLSTDSWQGLSGWVSADYIECPCGREAYYANEPESAKWGRAVRNVSMREVASWESAEMYRLKAGELVQILGSYRDEDRNSWIRVAYEDGKTGFVPTEAVGQVAQGEWPEIAGQRTRVWFAVLSAYAREILAYEASTGESAAVSSAALADMDLDGLTDLLFLMKNAKGEQELRMYSFEQGRVERMLTAPWTWNTEGTSIAFHSLNSARCYVENTSRDMSYRGLSAYEQDAEGGAWQLMRTCSVHQSADGKASCFVDGKPATEEAYNDTLSTIRDEELETLFSGIVGATMQAARPLDEMSLFLAGYRLSDGKPQPTPEPTAEPTPEPTARPAVTAAP